MPDKAGATEGKMDARIYLEEVYPGILRTSVRTAMYSQFLPGVELYAVCGKDKVLFVDSGLFPEVDLTMFQEVLFSRGLTWEDGILYLTHEHVDHMGVASRLQELGVDVVAGPTEERLTPEDLREFYEIAGIAEAGIEYQSAIEALRFLEGPKFSKEAISLCKKHDGIACKPRRLSGDEVLEVGDFKFSLISLNGHSEDQFGLFDSKSGIFFGGDQLIDGITPRILTCRTGTDSLNRFLESLSAVEALHPQMVLAGHGEPIIGFSALMVLINSYREFFLKGSNNVQRLLTKCDHPMTVLEVETMLHAPKEGGIIKDSEAVLLCIRLVKTFSYLEYLYERGALRRDITKQGAARYSCNT